MQDASRDVTIHATGIPGGIRSEQQNKTFMTYRSVSLIDDTGFTNV